MGPNPCSMLGSQENPYTTRPFSISLWSANRRLTRSSMGDVGTKFLYPKMVVMSVYTLYSYFRTSH